MSTPVERYVNTSVAKLFESGRGAVRAWRTFWFNTEPGYTLGVVRIALGFLVFLWSLEVGQDLYDKFGVDGIVPQAPSYPFLWGVFYAFQSHQALLIGWIVLMVASIVMIAGWHSRLAAVLVFVMVMSFERRNPWIFNSGDALIRILTLYVALSPCGAALSLDQRRRAGSFWSAETIKVWPLRLLQVQVSIIYVGTVIAKLHGDTWQNGTAVAYSLRLDDMLLLPTPGWLTDSPVMANAMTWGTLLVEFAIGVLVWNKRWRTKVLIAGVILHLTISLTMVVGFFSLAMFVLYLAFVPWERSKAVALNVENRLRALLHMSARSEAVDVSEAVVAAAPDAGAAAAPAETEDGGGRHRTDVDGDSPVADSPEDALAPRVAETPVTLS